MEFEKIVAPPYWKKLVNKKRQFGIKEEVQKIQVGEEAEGYVEQ